MGEKKGVRYMIWLGIIATGLMIYYAGYLFRCEYYFSKLEDQALHSSQAQQPPQAEYPHISIIVPARNEEEHIRACLTDLFAQEYPDGTFEVILVNDHSEDRTREIALAAGLELGEKSVQIGEATTIADDESMITSEANTIIGEVRSTRRVPNFKVLDLKKKQGVAYKKAAVARGIEEAKGEIILVTDADCRMGPGWLAAMVRGFEVREGMPKVGMVSGPVLLESKTIFEHFQALEFMGLIAVGAGSIGTGSPNMCNGANLAYRKEVFEEVGGFSGIDQIASGDDELLMHKIADQTNWRIAFAKRPEAIVRTKAHRTWKAFRDQRLRWVSKSTHYQQSSITWTLILSYLAILGLPVLLVVAFFTPVLWPFFWINLGLKILAEATILRAAARFFDKLPLLRWLIPEQLAHIVYVLWVGIAGNRKSYTWKGRKVK